MPKPWIDQKRRRALLPILWARAGGLCPLCETPLDPRRIDIDHIIPRAKGGSDELDNLQPTHPRCNVRKGSKALTAEVLVAIRSPAPTGVTTTVRLPVDTHAKLVRLARYEYRTIRQQIQHIIKQAVADIE